jgi:hemoglobin-like flavoprotein
MNLAPDVQYIWDRCSAVPRSAALTHNLHAITSLIPQHAWHMDIHVLSFYSMTHQHEAEQQRQLLRCTCVYAACSGMWLSS